MRAKTVTSEQNKQGVNAMFEKVGQELVEGKAGVNL